MVYDLYPLPLSLKPCEPVDTTDTWYINQPHDDLVNPLKKVLYIELYNEKWFNILFQISIPPFTYQHDTLSCQMNQFLLFHQLSNFMKRLILAPLPSHFLRK